MMQSFNSLGEAYQMTLKAKDKLKWSSNIERRSSKATKEKAKKGVASLFNCIHTKREWNGVEKLLYSLQ